MDKPRPGRNVDYSTWYIQKYTATKIRGIEWQLSLNEWIKWWETQLGPDWRKLRGSGFGKYVMGRKGNVGPYSLDNIECVLFEENAKQANEKFWSDPVTKNAKLTKEQVLIIFYNKDSVPSIAKEYGVGEKTIRRIRNGSSWKHVTKQEREGR